MFGLYDYRSIIFKDLPISSKCYKCGKTYYRSNRDNGKCPVCLQNERLRKYKKGGK